MAIITEQWIVSGTLLPTLILFITSRWGYDVVGRGLSILSKE